MGMAARVRMTTTIGISTMTGKGPSIHSHVKTNDRGAIISEEITGVDHELAAYGWRYRSG